MATEAVANVVGASGATTAIDGVAVSFVPSTVASNQAFRAAQVIAKSDGSANYADPDGAGNLQVKLNAVGVTSLPVNISAATATSVVNVASTVTSVLSAASSYVRKGALFYNNGTGIVYLSLGGTATTTSFSVPIPAGGFYEMQFAFQGAISAIVSGSSCALNVTEFQ